jgi:hypothetical protein
MSARISSRSALAISLLGPALLTLGIWIVSIQIGPVSALFEPSSPAKAGAYFLVISLTCSVALAALLFSGATLTQRSRFALLCVGVALTFTSLVVAQIAAPFWVIVCWFSNSFYQEARA